MPSVRSVSTYVDEDNRTSITGGALPAGWQPGDVVLIVLAVAGSPTSFTDTGSNWALSGGSAGHSNTGGAAFGSNIAYRTMQSGDTWPSVSGSRIEWSNSGKFAVLAVCVQPDAGESNIAAGMTISSATVSATAATTHTHPSFAAGGDTGMSLLINAARAANSGATAVSTTPPTNWTEPAGGDVSTVSGNAPGSRQVQAAASFRAAQTGTITPGAATISQAGATTTANLYHVFFKATGGGSPPARTADFMPFFM